MIVSGPTAKRIGFSVSHQAAYMTAMALFCIFIVGDDYVPASAANCQQNLFGVRFFGESEFVFAMMKGKSLAFRQLFG